MSLRHLLAVNAKEFILLWMDSGFFHTKSVAVKLVATAVEKMFLNCSITDFTYRLFYVFCYLVWSGVNVDEN